MIVYLVVQYYDGCNHIISAWANRRDAELQVAELRAKTELEWGEGFCVQELRVREC